MVEESLKMKKKDQINFSEQESIRLQAKSDEDERLTREKDEANVALTEEWNELLPIGSKITSSGARRID
ncbi:hypothetical protein Tco_1387267 [Tanacetum coccineum]